LELLRLAFLWEELYLSPTFFSPSVSPLLPFHFVGGGSSPESVVLSNPGWRAALSEDARAAFSARGGLSSTLILGLTLVEGLAKFGGLLFFLGGSAFV